MRLHGWWGTTGTHPTSRSKRCMRVQELRELGTQLVEGTEIAAGADEAVVEVDGFLMAEM